MSPTLQNFLILGIKTYIHEGYHTKFQIKTSILFINETFKYQGQGLPFTIPGHNKLFQVTKLLMYMYIMQSIKNLISIILKYA